MIVIKSVQLLHLLHFATCYACSSCYTCYTCYACYTCCNCYACFVCRYTCYACYTFAKFACYTSYRRLLHLLLLLRFILLLHFLHLLRLLRLRVLRYTCCACYSTFGILASLATFACYTSCLCHVGYACYIQRLVSIDKPIRNSFYIVSWGILFVSLFYLSWRFSSIFRFVLKNCNQDFDQPIRTPLHWGTLTNLNQSAKRIKSYNCVVHNITVKSYIKKCLCPMWYRWK